MSVLDNIRTHGHEKVTFFQDRDTGLLAIVAIHDTTLGPGLGGCRMYPYDSLEDALFDVLRLSEAMTYKNSLSGLNHGGGKSVIIADGGLQEGRAELFRCFGRKVRSLEGAYITAEDMGTSVADMNYVLEECDHVAGRDPKIGGGGDPSPYTAKGVFDGMRACFERAYGSPDYTGRRVAVQGLGHVGYILAKHLAEAGAKLILTDLNEKTVQEACSEFGAIGTTPEEIVAADCDVFSPCAVGGIVNPTTVPNMKCQILAGAANNQLLGEETEQMLFDRGILYAPDYAINAGGVILCADELEPGGYTPSRVNERVGRIYGTVGRILDESKRTGELPGKVALRLAKERVEEARTQQAA